jgi:hypothetical protein
MEIVFVLNYRPLLGPRYVETGLLMSSCQRRPLCLKATAITWPCREARHRRLTREVQAPPDSMLKMQFMTTGRLCLRIQCLPLGLAHSSALRGALAAAAHWQHCSSLFSP